MKCKKCGYKNVSQAIYCYKCGNRFTKEEKENIFLKKILKKIKRIKEIYETATLSKVTGHIAFKIASVLLVLVAGIYSIYVNGNVFKVVDGEDYTFTYNDKLNEYYLYLNHDESNLNLYLPHEIEKFYMSYYDQNDQIIEKKVFENLNDIKVNIDLSGNYYKISMNESEIKESTLKIYALNVGEQNE